MPKHLVIPLAIFAAIFSACGSSNDCDADFCGLCPADQSGVKICSFVANPPTDESVTLKNYNAATAALSGWSLWDSDALSNGTGQKTLGASDSVEGGQTLTVGGLPFNIGDSDETITLKNSSGAVAHQRSN